VLKAIAGVSHRNELVRLSIAPSDPCQGESAVFYENVAYRTEQIVTRALPHDDLVDLTEPEVEAVQPFDFEPMNCHRSLGFLGP
jgi:hypothetical protein